MITQREDGTSFLNLQGTVFFNWWSDDPKAYMLFVTLYGDTLGGSYMPPVCFRFFTLCWNLANDE